MSKHTPGPWKVTKDGRVMTTGARYVVARMGDGSPVEYQSDRAIGNARLIAAAPDLLAACKQLVVAAGDRHMMPWTKEKVLQFVEIYAAMRAAIAKAEGVS